MPSGHFSATYDHTFRALWINCGSLMCFFLATIGICVTEEQIQLDNQNSHSMSPCKKGPFIVGFLLLAIGKKTI